MGRKNDIRFLRWIIYRCQKQPPDSQYGIQIPLLYNPLENPQSLYYTFIHSVDAWKAPLKMKREILERIRTEWSAILRLSKLKWLDKENVAQIEWAWSYTNNYIDKNELQTRRFHPTKYDNIYTDIISTFDNWTADTLRLHELKTSMKQAWAQQKYRTNLKDTNKKQSTYALSIESKKQLETLAKANNVNLNHMLEYIIGEAHKNLKAGKRPKHLERDNDS